MKTYRIIAKTLMFAALTLLGRQAHSQASLPQEKKAEFIVCQFKNKLKTSPYIAYQFTYRATGKRAKTAPRIKGELRLNAHNQKDGLYHQLYIKGTSVFGEGDKSKTRSFSFAVNNQDEVAVYMPRHQLMLTADRYKYLSALSMPFVSTLINHSIGFFKKDIEHKVKFMGEKKVAGASCYQVGYEDQGDTLRWCFDQKTYLLRQFKIYGSWGGYVIEHDQFVTKNAVPANAFKIETLAGTQVKAYSTGRPAAGDVAPDWTLPDYEGNELKLSSLKGKVVVLDFWATWCPPCIKAIPGLQKLHEKYEKQGVKFIGLAYKDNGKPLKFMKKRGVTYTILNAKTSGEAYGVTQWPTLYVIGKDGKVRDYFLGYHGAKGEHALEKAIEEAVSDKPLAMKPITPAPDFSKYIGSYKNSEGLLLRVFKNNKGALSLEFRPAKAKKSRFFPFIHLSGNYFMPSGDLGAVFELKTNAEGKVTGIEGPGIIAKKL